MGVEWYLWCKPMAGKFNLGGNGDLSLQWGPRAQGGKGFGDFGNEVGDKPRRTPGAAEFLLNLIKELHLPELNAAFTVIFLISEYPTGVRYGAGFLIKFRNFNPAAAGNATCWCILRAFEQSLNL